MTTRIGQQLGNYRLVHHLGQGGFAEVYLGEHAFLKTSAAIKILNANVAQHEAQSFLQEAQTIATLKHPHIVRTLDFGIDHQMAFLVMDYASGGTLRARHPRGSLVPVPTILSYVEQIAVALQYAHDHRIVHRDVKPENMLVDADGTILLSDFGIAVIAHTTQSLSTQEAIGTIAYMAPEQFNGKPRPASDQYSLGVVVYEWLAGRRPFDGSYPEIVKGHLLSPPPSPRMFNPAISPEIEQVILTSLAKDPKDRFPEIKVFADALKQAASNRRPVSLFTEEPQRSAAPPWTTLPANHHQTSQTVSQAEPEQPPRQTPRGRRRAEPEAQPQQVQQQVHTAESEKKAASEQKTVDTGTVASSFVVDGLCLAIVLSLLFHSWWVLGGVFLASLIIAGIIVGSIKTKADEGAASGCAGLLFIPAWGLVGWLSDSFMSSVIHFQFLPQTLAAICGIGGFFCYFILYAMFQPARKK